MSLRTVLNKWLRHRGYEIVRIDRFKERLFKEYANEDDFCFVQIGANDGVKFDDLYQFVTSRKCRGVVVEPLKYYFEKLKFNYAKYPNILPLNCAVHKTDKHALLHYVDPEKLGLLPEWAEGIGSFNPEHHKKSGTESEYIISEEVNCMSLMDIIAESEFDHVNFLQVDVEGYDGEVIRMIDFDIIKPRIIKFEHGSLAESEVASLYQLLESQGYDILKQGKDTIASLMG